MRPKQLASVLTAMVIAIAGLVGGGSPGHTFVSAAPVDDAAALAYPAFVFTGRCAELDPTPRFTLADVAVAPVSGNPIAPAAPEMLPVALAELLAEPHAVVVSTRRGSPVDPLACGDVGGTLSEGALAIGLEEQNRSGYAGIARLRGDGERTRLTAFLAEGLAGTASARKSAWATAAEVGCGCASAQDPNAMAITVAMTDLLFVPRSFQVNAGGTVTWVNVTPADRTVTLFRAGKLVADAEVPAFGPSFIYTAAETGTYDYISTSDPSLRGRFVVTAASTVPNGATSTAPLRAAGA